MTSCGRISNNLVHEIALLVDLKLIKFVLENSVSQRIGNFSKSLGSRIDSLVRIS